MRLSAVVLVLGLALPALSSGPAAETDPDPDPASEQEAPSPPGSASALPSVGDSITVRLEKGTVLHVAYVKQAGLGSLDLIRADGETQTVGAQRVRSITDAQGQDVTNDVIRRRKSVGSAPAAYAWRPKPHHEPCLTPRPLPECKTCMVTQAAFVRRLGSEYEYDAVRGFYATFDIGATRNLSPSTAVGGDLYLGFDDEHARVGVKARFRRWFGQRVSLDIAPGILFAGSDYSVWHSNFPGFVGEVSVTFDGRLGVIGGVESIPLVFESSLDWDDLSFEYTDVTWYVGGKLTGGPGAAVTLAGLVAAMVIGVGVSTVSY